MAGKVIVEDQRIDKAGSLWPEDSQIRIKGQKTFVSRGGEKLKHAIDHFALIQEFSDKVVLDIGSSTGGFTDCVLQHKAKLVYAVDIGSHQLHWSLKKNPLVISVEQTDIRLFNLDQSVKIDWIVADISFNTLQNLASSILRLSSIGSRFLLLVKPQFELKPLSVPKGGVVTDENQRNLALKKACASLTAQGLDLIDSYDCAVKGRSGNQETFVFLKRTI